MSLVLCINSCFFFLSFGLNLSMAGFGVFDMSLGFVSGESVLLLCFGDS